VQEAGLARNLHVADVVLEKSRHIAPEVALNLIARRQL
jgi:hypothetical protein